MTDTPERARLVAAVEEAAALRRSTILRGSDPIPKRFEGDWVAVPLEDFSALRGALNALHAFDAAHKGEG